MNKVWQGRIGKLNYLRFEPTEFSGVKKYPIIIHFHGTDDPAVFFEESQKMVNAVNQKGGKAKLTEYKGVGHNCWDLTYGNSEIYAWLLSKGD